MVPRQDMHLQLAAQDPRQPPGQVTGPQPQGLQVRLVHSRTHKVDCLQVGNDVKTILEGRITWITTPDQQAGIGQLLPVLRTHIVTNGKRTHKPRDNGINNAHCRKIAQVQARLASRSRRPVVVLLKSQ